MEFLEITQKESLRREAAAQRLHALAVALARHNELEFQRGGTRFKVKVPDEILLVVELEVGDDGTELEIELSW